MAMLDPVDWCNRCAERLVELDQQISPAEAQALAIDIYSFERTRAMAPAAAADLVAEEMARSEPGPFERRSLARRAGRRSGEMSGPPGR